VKKCRAGVYKVMSVAAELVIIVALALLIWIGVRIELALLGIAQHQRDEVASLGGLYPAFSGEQVEHSTRDFKRCQAEYKEADEAFRFSMKSETSSPKERRAAADRLFDAESECDTARKRRDFVLTANIRALTGAAALPQIWEEWTMFFFSHHDVMERLKKKDEWLAKLGLLTPTT
jgi:hypothetical protein